MRTPTRLLGASALAAALFLGGSATMAEASAPVAHSAHVAIKATGNVCLSELPAEAGDTLDLIAKGGPFPYDQDGTVFQNREGVLPQQDTGYYHEYTVITPGSPDRGARRIVTGEATDEDYYTGDHYETFDLIDQGC